MMLSSHARRLILRALPLIAMAYGVISHGGESDPVSLLGSDISGGLEIESVAPNPAIEDRALDALFEMPASYGIDALLNAQSKLREIRGSKEIGINRKVAPATVFIVQGNSTCSGTLVGEAGEVLTSWHCVRGKGEVVVRLHPTSGVSNLLVATIVKIDASRDLALLRLPVIPKSIAPVALANVADLQVGADVYAIGHPSTLNWSFVKGIVSQIYDKRVWNFETNRHEAEVIQAQIPLYPGNSGGPLVSEAGLLVGVSTAKQTDGPFTFSVSVQEVRRFLKDTSSFVESAPANQPGCVRKKVREGRSTDNSGTVSLYDTDCDGKIDTALSVPDDAAKPIIVARSSDGSGQIDALRIGRDGDQKTYIKGSNGPVRIEASTFQVGRGSANLKN